MDAGSVRPLVKVPAYHRYNKRRESLAGHKNSRSCHFDIVENQFALGALPNYYSDIIPRLRDVTNLDDYSDPVKGTWKGYQK